MGGVPLREELLAFMSAMLSRLKYDDFKDHLIIPFDQPSVRDFTKEVKALQDRINAIISTKAYNNTAQALREGEFAIPYIERKFVAIGLIDAGDIVLLFSLDTAGMFAFAD
ncbi:uncharacterized protein LDX57_012569 [Aspergillus melleus]|uniref:uncharacterized protein n=1 Tax=Aspergillus melleus TaxID=138277 RepID=UPI001E8CF1A9|nr:uncharacterized protein LDX57_012569 [Aspergillus melleus]KAH8434937.1 hypothetical protein LDX57_012569 [Aspergillus melleus]